MPVHFKRWKLIESYHSASVISTHQSFYPTLYWIELHFTSPVSLRPSNLIGQTSGCTISSHSTSDKSLLYITSAQSLTPLSLSVFASDNSTMSGMNVRLSYTLPASCNGECCRTWIEGGERSFCEHGYTRCTLCLHIWDGMSQCTHSFFK